MSDDRPATLSDIHPDRLYTPEDVARVLHLNVDSVYRLGRTPRLPRTPVGPKGGKTLFLGRVIIEYARPQVA